MKEYATLMTPDIETSYDEGAKLRFSRRAVWQEHSTPAYPESSLGRLLAEGWQVRSSTALYALNFSVTMFVFILERDVPAGSPPRGESL